MSTALGRPRRADSSVGTERFVVMPLGAPRSAARRAPQVRSPRCGRMFPQRRPSFRPCARCLRPYVRGCPRA